MKKYDAIVIGGGIAGLGCAKTLTDCNFGNFRLISDQLGGRIKSSKDGKVNYGAYYSRSDYRHVKPFMKPTRRIGFQHVHRLCNGKSRPIYGVMLRHPLATAKLFLLLRKFNKHYQRFKRACVSIQSREVIESDAWLFQLHQQAATEFLSRHRLCPLRESLVNPIVWGTALVDVEEISASTMLFLLLILVHKTHEFEFQLDALTGPFQSKITIDTVKQIHRYEGGWQISTTSGDRFYSKSVVVALPVDKATGLLDLDLELNHPVNARMVHVSGIPKPPFNKGRYLVVAPELGDVIIASQADGTWIVYTRKKEIELTNYFHDWQPIGEQLWEPAFNVGKRLIDYDLGDGLYLIGDHNAVSMEDSFISGVFAANKILEQDH